VHVSIAANVAESCSFNYWYVGAMSEDRWLTDEEQHAWRNLIAVVELLSRRLDTQLQRESQLSHFEYYVLGMLSEAPEATLRMTALAGQTSSTLPRLSHVVSRLEQRGYVTRSPCASDRRATNASLTEDGWAKVLAAAPGHARTVVNEVLEPLRGRDVADLDRIMGRILGRLTERRE
jgi:DNA-binding MarR family transcriptional regulator